MRYVIWALRLVIFLLVILFAVKNMEPVTVRFFGEASVADMPLVVVMLASFFLGAVYMFLLTLPARFSRRRELSRLKGEVQHLQHDLQTVQMAKPIADVPAVTPPDGFVANK